MAVGAGDSPGSAAHGPAAATDTPSPDKRVEPLELFFDLVFVFAITQVTARLAARPDAGRACCAAC